MKKLSSDELKSVFIAVLIMVVGILFCCSLSIGIDGLSVIIGLILMVIGVLLLANLFVGGRGVLSIEGMIGVVLLSLGILFISSKLAGIIFAYIPWLLIVLGCVIITEVLIDKFFKKQNNLTRFIISLIIGGFSIILGLCLKLIDGFMEYASIILGILLIIYAGYMLYMSFFRAKKDSNN